MCIGMWNRRFCNHWVSHDALVQYIITEAEDGRFSFRCPVCSPKRCSRCVYHASSQREEGCCYISPKQIRSVLSEEQMERLLELQEKSFRTVNRDSIVQCPHPDCQYFYVLGPEDMAAAGPSNGVLLRCVENCLLECIGALLLRFNCSALQRCGAVVLEHSTQCILKYPLQLCLYI